MIRSRHAIPLTAVALATFAATAGPAAAQDPIVDEETEKKVLAGPKADKDGWKVGANVGATASLNDSRQVVGSDDGSTIQVGGVLKADARLFAGHHEWENLLEIKHTQTKTPQIEPAKDVTITVTLPSYLRRVTAFEADADGVKGFDGCSVEDGKARLKCKSIASGRVFVLRRSPR